MRHHDDRQWDERVVDYIYGELGHADAARFEAEMALRPELAAEVRELQAVASLAAADASPIPEPPETAVTEALKAARTRCDELRDASPGLWEQISAWLLTSQLAGALTLVLIISVGIYTVGTGVFRRDTADEPSVQLEMAPVEPAAEAKAEAKDIPVDKDVGVRVDEDVVRPAPAPPEGSAQALVTESVDQALPDAWTDREDRVEDKTTELPRTRARAANEGLRSLVDHLTTAGNLDAALAAEDSLAEEADTRSMDTPAHPKSVEVREKSGGETGNFVKKTMSKPEDAGAAEVAEKKMTKTMERPKKEQSKDGAKKKKAKSRKVARLLRRTEEEAPASEKSDKKKRDRSDRQTEMRHAPTKSLLDGIVVPPDAGPARKQPAPAPVITSAESLNGTTMNDDKSDEVTAEAEPSYMVRPEAAEAPGISLGSMERGVKGKDEREEMKKETGEAEKMAPAPPAQAPAPPPPTRKGGAAASAVCAALAKAIEEAEDAED